MGSFPHSRKKHTCCIYLKGNPPSCMAFSSGHSHIHSAVGQQEAPDKWHQRLNLRSPGGLIFTHTHARRNKSPQRLRSAASMSGRGRRIAAGATRRPRRSNEGTPVMDVQHDVLGGVVVVSLTGPRFGARLASDPALKVTNF